MDSYNVIANQPIVIDNGSGVVKAGFAGDEIPKCNFRNCVSRPKHLKIMQGAIEGDTFIGNIAEDHRLRFLFSGDLQKLVVYLFYKIKFEEKKMKFKLKLK